MGLSMLWKSVNQRTKRKRKRRRVNTRRQAWRIGNSTRGDQIMKDAIGTVITNESIVLGPAREPGFDIKKLEEVWLKFEAART